MNRNYVIFLATKICTDFRFINFSDKYQKNVLARGIDLYIAKISFYLKQWQKVCGTKTKFTTLSYENLQNTLIKKKFQNIEPFQRLFILYITTDNGIT